MVQVLRAPERGPSRGKQFSDAIGGGLQAAAQVFGDVEAQKEQKIQQDLQRQQEIKKLTYEQENKEKLQQQKYDLEGRNQQELEKIKSLQKSEQLQGKKSEDLQANIAPLQAALARVNEMKNIRKKGNLGRGSSVLGFFGGETARDRGEYQTLGNSLIQYASNIPIRNRIEFEKLAGHLSDPSTTDSEAEGILNALEEIIGSSLSKFETNDETPMKNKVGIPKNTKKPPLSSFHR